MKKVAKKTTKETVNKGGQTVINSKDGKSGAQDNNQSSEAKNNGGEE